MEPNEIDDILDAMLLEQEINEVIKEEQERKGNNSGNAFLKVQQEYKGNELNTKDYAES